MTLNIERVQLNQKKAHINDLVVERDQLNQKKAQMNAANAATASRQTSYFPQAQGNLLRAY